MSNKPEATYNNFPGEFNAFNPSDIPQGAAERISNGVIRNQGAIEPLRGMTAQSFPPAVTPLVAGVIDASRYIFGTTQDNTTPVTGLTSYGTGPASNVVLYSLDALGNNNNTTLIRQWGWDLGIPALSTTNNISFFAAQRQGWIMTGRGLFKVERSSDNTSAPLAQVNLFPANLFPPSAGDQASLFQTSGCRASTGTGALDASQKWLPAGYSVAYRFLTARRDPLTLQVRYSEPSDRVYVTNNTGAASAVQLSVFNAPLAPPDAFTQVYRCLAVPPGIIPSDEMFLVTELPMTSPNGSDPSPTFQGFAPTASIGLNTQTIQNYTDITPGRIDDAANAQIYVPLYTNRGLGNGLQSSKFNAPVAQVSGVFGGRSYYLNTQSQQSLLILLAGTTQSGLSTTSRGFTPGDTITIDGVVFTGTTSGGVAAVPNGFVVYDALTLNSSPPSGYVAAQASPSLAVRLTAQSLIAVVNAYFQGNTNPNGPVHFSQDRTIIANYISTGVGDVGQILLRRPVPGSPPFTVTTSSTNGWAQNYTQGVVSNNSANAGGVIWSDLNQPDSCPLGNQTVLGSAGAACNGFVALRDFAIIFKEDGAWTVRETPRGPQFAPLDTTVRLVSPRAAVALGNECIALTSQGVVRIGEFGVENISQPIQREILGYLQRSQQLFTAAFAIGYEAEREYWLCLPSGANTPFADVVKIWNGKTNAWTTANIGVLSCGAEVPTSASTARVATTALALGFSQYASGSSTSLKGWKLERKTQSNSDYINDRLTPAGLTVVGNNGNGTFRLSSTDITMLPFLTVGSLLRLPARTGQQTFVVAATSVNAAQTLLLIDVNIATPTTTIVGGDLAGGYFEPAIVTNIIFMPENAGVPLLEKRWDGIYLYHRYWNGSFMSTGWATEKTSFPASGTEAGPGASIVTWGNRPWNKTAWQCAAKDYVLSTSIPVNYERAGVLTATLTYYNAYNRFELSAITFNIASVTDRTIQS